MQQPEYYTQSFCPWRRTSTVGALRDLAKPQRGIEDDRGERSRLPNERTASTRFHASDVPSLIAAGLELAGRTNLGGCGYPAGPGCILDPRSWECDDPWSNIMCSAPPRPGRPGPKHHAAACLCPFRHCSLITMSHRKVRRGCTRHDVGGTWRGQGMAGVCSGPALAGSGRPVYGGMWGTGGSDDYPVLVWGCVVLMGSGAVSRGKGGGGIAVSWVWARVGIPVAVMGGWRWHRTCRCGCIALRISMGLGAVAPAPHGLRGRGGRGGHRAGPHSWMVAWW